MIPHSVNAPARNGFQGPLMPSESSNTPARAEAPRFFPVSVESLSGSELEMDLYIKHGGRPEPVLFRAVGLHFTDEDRSGLLRNSVQFLYVRSDQHKMYRRMLNARLEEIFADEDTHTTERARFIRSACSRMIEDVMLFPGNADAIESVVDISKQFASWSHSDPATFDYLLDMSAHDFLTLAHMVNVGVGCGMLVREMHPEDTEMLAVAIQGGLLHDIGKRGMPVELLNKEGRLSSKEWEAVKRHPQQGYDELKGHHGIPQFVLEMARDHHERIDGKGYPRGVRDGLISYAARVCSVVDVYDALTAARPYRAAIHPLDVLKIMADGDGTQFDSECLAAWSRVVKRMIKEDPERAPMAGFSAPPAQMNLENLSPREKVAPKAACASVASSAGKSERRRFDRFPLGTVINAMFIYQGKPCPVVPGEVFELRTTDVSKGGLCLECEYPFSLNDVLVLMLPTNNGKTLRRYAKVVRVRSRDGKWRHGVSFVSEGELSQIEGGASERAA